MNFGQAFLLLFALANSVNADDKSRELATSRDSSTHYVKGYKEHLGSCDGAVCGLWGDPHILSCDGLGYDCNASGLFTLMKNFLYNIQANFIHVNSIEMGKVLGWGNFPIATYTNDVIIQNVERDDVPAMQFTFPRFHDEEDTTPKERGCFVRFSYDPELTGHGRSWHDDIVQCRERCESIATCTKFTYKYDGRCQVFGEDAELYEIPDHWGHRASGPVDKCGHPAHYKALDDNPAKAAERAKAKVIGNGSTNTGGCKHGDGCPVLFYLDGVLQDISNKGNGAYLYGSANSDVSAKFDGYNKIKITHKTKAGGISEIMLETSGDGPGELFSCHWNVFVCLPEVNENDFHAYGVGLFGSPDNNSRNDWMTPDGQQLPLPHHDGLEWQAAYDYCLDNWCVSQEDSLMTYPDGMFYDDVKCVHEDYIPIQDVADPNFDCIINIEKIHEVCDKKPMMLRASCEIDCCLGGCKIQDEMEEEIKGLVELSEEIEDCIYPSPTPTPDPICDDKDNFLGTGETACPSSSGSVVKVISSTTSVDIPNGQPVIYGLKFVPVVDDDHGRRITFRVDNPYGSTADAYVRYSKEVGTHANDPACESLADVKPGCDTDSEEITVGCVEYPGMDPFAIVDIFFASSDSFVTSNADSSTDIEKCCKAPDYGSNTGIIKYTFKIQCICPTSA